MRHLFVGYIDVDSFSYRDDRPTVKYTCMWLWLRWPVSLLELLFLRLLLSRHVFLRFRASTL